MRAQPHILLIMSDNHAADLLGCYGNPEIRTPHLDRLAAEGMRFDEAYCVNGMCSPCRASVLTGLMPSQHGIHNWIDDRRMDNWPDKWNALAEFETLPEILRRDGYDTALIGKYHLGAPWLPQNGFDHWVTFPLGHTRDFWGNRVIENGLVTTFPGHIVDYFTEQAVSYLSQPHDERPFFLMLTYNAPYGHWPAIQGPARNRFAPLYAETEMHSVPREGISQAMLARVLLALEDSGEGLDYAATLQIPNDLTSLRNFYSQMSMVDDGVGRVLATLAERGLAEETLVIYTSDHGFSTGRHGFWGHGQATWPANTHRAAFNIPLLMRQPQRIAAGSTTNHLVSQIDLFATILAGAGLGAEAGLARDLWPLLAGTATDWDDRVFMEQEETRSLRTPEWLWMQRFQGSVRYPLADALFHTADEDSDVSQLPENRAIIHSLRAQVDDFFSHNATPTYDLWQGGTAKSNTSRPWLWPAVWGDAWAPIL